jgi:hypothetical protein
MMGRAHSGGLAERRTARPAHEERNSFSPPSGYNRFDGVRMKAWPGCFSAMWVVV